MDFSPGVRDGSGTGPGSVVDDLNFQSFNDIVKNSVHVDGDSDSESDEYNQDFPRMNNSSSVNFDYYTIDKFNSFSQALPSTKSSLKVCHFNIRGIDKNYDSLVLYLNSIHSSFDIICLSECHIQIDRTNIDDRYSLVGYDKHLVYSNIKFGGCMIYYKTCLQAKPVKSLTKSTASCDYAFINIPKSKHNPGTLVGCYYRHCLKNRSDIINFINDFELSLDTNLVRKSKVVLTGDYNIDLCKVNHNNDVTTYFNCLLSNNLESHILKPTRIQYYPNSLQIKSATLIDHISSNLYENVCHAGNLFYSDSDHFGNFVIFENYFKQSGRNKNTEPQMRRYLNKIDNEKLRDDMNSYDWYQDVCNDDLELNSCTANLITNLKDLCDRHAPRTSISKRKMKYCDKPWINKELLGLIRTKNTLYSKKMNFPSEVNNTNFSKMRTKVNHEKRNKKKMYLTKYFNEHRTNVKKTWEGLYMALEVTKNKKTVGTNIKDNKTGIIYNNPTDISNKFAEYFENVPSQVRDKLPTTESDFYKYMPESVSQSMYLGDTDPLEVFNLIHKLKNSCSTGDTDIPNQFLKMLSFPLSYLLAYIINRSLTTGQMPRLLKIGKQTPVFKSGDKLFNNYRPITVVNSFAKIVEKVAGSRLVSYLERHKILNIKQFGFRKKHSTIHAMINLFDTCLESLENRLTVGGVFLDISKAFDCVDHHILLKKLEIYGIRGIALDWFKSYLTDRELFVSVDGVSSNTYYLKHGVPQGSVLGPILFLIYINDIVNSSTKFDFSMFADDTSLILKTANEEYDYTMKQELLGVMKWFDNNLLLLNVDKTKYLYFGPYNNSIKPFHSCIPDYMYMKKLDIEPPITESNEVKYLGIVFDSSLKFTKQINSTTMKINRMVGMLWQSRDLPLTAKMTLYHSLVASYLNYGILIWGSSLAINLTGRFPINHIPNQLKPVHVAHNKIIRAITCSKKYNKDTKEVTHTEPLLKRLNLLSLNDIYYLHLALFAYDCLLTNNLPETFDDYIKTVDSVYNSRTHALDVHITSVGLNSTYGSVRIASSYFWNLIPITIRSTNFSRNSFKKQVKTWLISKYND